MMKHISLILFYTFTSICCMATIEAPSGPMALLSKFKGNWKVELKNDNDNLPFTEHTSSYFSHNYNTFTIYKAYSNGQFSFSESVRIANENGSFYSAVLYKNHKTSIFYSDPKNAFKILVMESKKSQETTPNYLIIDFSECPEKPPTFRVSDKKPATSTP